MITMKTKREQNKNTMSHSTEFFKSIVNSVREHIVVINQKGMIQYVNTAWIDFGIANQLDITSEWQQVNYLEVCDKAAENDEEYGKTAADGIRGVARNKLDSFYMEYPCHSKDEKRWFIMRVTPLNWQYPDHLVISHQNITERKLAEEEIQRCSRLDGLTGLANRRFFNEFLNKEWRRCERLRQPLSLILLDVDHFKLFNDHYGHVAGDECLKKIGTVLNSYAKRPSDLSARYGGEEFALILGNIDIRESTQIANAILHSIRDLAIPHEYSNSFPGVTVSLGVTMTYPCMNKDETDLIKAADKSLYRAKENGRNRIFADIS
ncbi:response regulator [Candidatus Scalindua japonica]|uniref:diguanylate cyclase n=1 Tax=Candidatus Scalindua japonica TaxID=1284222 RepID=A0A286U1H2_9BACT|nr:sensor domain-containing diguanylate cyclase [Candidatus Scalindua japonica]GAX61989.1 response regulator [Candidatus Scalindua japonica]